MEMGGHGFGMTSAKMSKITKKMDLHFHATLFHEND